MCYNNVKDLNGVLRVKNIHLKKLLSSFLLVFIAFSVLSMTSIAEEKKPSSVTFTYKANFPENQINKESGYYNLMMKPGQEQIVTISMENSSDKKSVIDLSLNGAKTNSNGVIEYGSNKLKNDKSLKFDFKKVVTGPNKVTLNPKEKKEVELKIKMPDTSYDGVISGGIQMIEEGQGEDVKNQGSMVINEYAYVVGMTLQVNDKPVKPSLKLNTVKPGQSNFRNTIFINYSNVAAVITNNMTAEVQITEKDKGTVIYEKKQSKMRMAPNSFINFPVDMNGEAMKAGDYTANILVTADEGIKEKWTKNFKITPEDADKYNERDVGLVQEKGLDWKLIAIIVAGFFIIVLIIFIIVHTMKKKKKKKSKKKKK